MKDNNVPNHYDLAKKLFKKGWTNTHIANKIRLELITIVAYRIEYKKESKSQGDKNG